jgi:hypothetical protein
VVSASPCASIQVRLVLRSRLGIRQNPRLLFSPPWAGFRRKAMARTSNRFAQRRGRLIPLIADGMSHTYYFRFSVKGLVCQAKPVRAQPLPLRKQSAQRAFALSWAVLMAWSSTTSSSSSICGIALTCGSWSSTPRFWGIFQQDVDAFLQYELQPWSPQRPSTFALSPCAFSAGLS